MNDKISNARDAALSKGRWITVQRIQTLRYWQADKTQPLSDPDLHAIMSDTRNSVNNQVSYWEGAGHRLSQVEEAVIKGDMAGAFRILLDKYGVEHVGEWRKQLAPQPPSVDQTKAALEKTFDRTQTLEALRGLEKHLTNGRLAYQRGTPDHRIMTDEIKKVRSLIHLLEQEAK